VKKAAVAVSADVAKFIASTVAKKIRSCQSYSKNFLKMINIKLNIQLVDSPAGCKKGNTA